MKLNRTPSLTFEHKHQSYFEIDVSFIDKFGAAIDKSANTFLFEYWNSKNMVGASEGNLTFDNSDLANGNLKLTGFDGLNVGNWYCALTEVYPLPGEEPIRIFDIMVSIDNTFGRGLKPTPFNQKIVLQKYDYKIIFKD